MSQFRAICPKLAVFGHQSLRRFLNSTKVMEKICYLWEDKIEEWESGRVEEWESERFSSF